MAASSSSFLTAATKPLSQSFQTLASPPSSLSSPRSLPVPRRRSALRVAARKWEPSKVVPQADRVLVRLEQLPEKSSGGVLLPKSAVKFERYLMGEILSVGADVGQVEAGKKVLFSDINAYEVCILRTEKELL
ncbi:10 kDa chaperonin 1, chloroplastic-like [Ananas comosus]|uniref:10 kDa chaperonin 1, chloroplastic-like n=1 Tax=Ananas comosus TaxID=4615 RepID=A0A6P5ECB3_ANACO|nr:10 kDa chaperonin 1, chloroplastic-like [Ananas comosus]